MITQPLTEFELPDSWPTTWTLDDLLDIVGPSTEIQHQAQRLSDPNYELNSPSHRMLSSFGQFVAAMQSNDPNDVYLTAQNSVHLPTKAAMEPILAACVPIPKWLGDNAASFVWLGKGTMTPLHYDKSHNTMCQLMGEKHVRLFSIDQSHLLDRSPDPNNVHSTLGWVTDEMIAERGLVVRDVHLRPGKGLFIPQGWWHCIRTNDIALTVVFAQYV